MAPADVIAGRGRAMAARLTDTAERLGVDPERRAAMAAAFEAVMEPRLRAGLDDHHPDYLHPARTALILMDDAGVSDATALTAALLTETRDRALRPDPDRLEAAGADVAGLVRAVPDPGEPDRVLERLVTAEARVRLIALAERLDLARHLHLRPPAEWGDYHALTRTAYAPAAARANAVLQRRFDWWCRTFERRFLTGR